MGLTFTKAYRDSKGNCYDTLEKAQVAEIQVILGISTDLAAAIVDAQEQIINVLTTCESSRPAARKANGAKRTSRKAKSDQLTLSDENKSVA